MLTYLVLALDTAMLALVCVLECMDLTGLEIHQWLGFALCPLILIHATLQYQWFITQFQKLLRKGFSWASKNVVLNTLLLVMMSAVLLSGLLASRQITSIFGEQFGSVHVWREIHGWLNFTVVVLVGLHLGLNWDWLMAVLRRRAVETPADAGISRQSNAPVTQPRTENLLRASGRGLGVVLTVLLSATVVYFVMGLLIVTPHARKEIQSPNGLSVAASASNNQLIPQPRPIWLSHGVEQLSVTVGLVVLVGLIGRYVFRLRL
jgi:cytochrome b561